MDSAESAARVKQSLEGREIYEGNNDCVCTLWSCLLFIGCCQLKFDFSRIPKVNVAFNDDRSRDFTDNSLPTYE